MTAVLWRKLYRRAPFATRGFPPGSSWLAAALTCLGIVIASVGGARHWMASSTAMHNKSLHLPVIPLENLSHDPEQEYFADGMTDALITGLAKVGSVRVTSRTSIIRYKGNQEKYRGDWAGTECGRRGGRHRDSFR